MKLATAELVKATRAHLSPVLASLLPGVLASMHGAAQAPEHVEDTVLGEALLRCVLGRVDAPQNELTSVTLSLADGDRMLGAADALAHPLMDLWLSRTIPEALAAPLIAGARGTSFAERSPVYVGVSVSSDSQSIWGSATLEFYDTAMGFRSWRAKASYEAGEAVPFSTTHEFSGSALYRIGSAAGTSTEAVGADKKAQTISNLSIGTGSLH